LHIDRQLPFLCVYRRPADGADPGTRQLVLGEAAYLVTSSARGILAPVSQLLDQVVETLSQAFGAFLLIEVWAVPNAGLELDPRAVEVPPRFRIYAPLDEELSPTVDALRRGLERLTILKRTVVVEIERVRRIHPPGLRALLPDSRARELHCTTLGIGVPPIYRDPETGTDYPLVLRNLRSRFGPALRRAVFAFANDRTTHRPVHYHALGRRAVVRAVWAVDAQLAAVSQSFDFLLQVTPVNSEAAWRQFRASRFERVPSFHYLPSPLDPALLKRQLYGVPIEKIEDPALHNLFEGQREELDRKITMLRDRNTPDFLHGSLQLYGQLHAELIHLAERILADVPPSREEGPSRGSLCAAEFARLATKEFRQYQTANTGFDAKAEVTSQIDGLLVSNGKLLIGQSLQVPAARADALIQHEVGTHLVTYFNGMAQPFRQLYTGLAGYDELQEGMAVLSEWLVGGLSRGRLRQLAARVVAVRRLVDGASFVETFRELDRAYGFSQRAAFTITMRVFRGGGLTKDAIYLRGLRAMLGYLGSGGELDALLVGKIAAEHIPLIRELQLRRILKTPPWRPRYLDTPQARVRLQRLRRGMTVLDLIRERNDDATGTGGQRCDDGGGRIHHDEDRGRSS
jgi:uncharacterized protein (TIGR02421 family)